MLQIVYVSAFIEQLREETGAGGGRAACHLAPALCAATPEREARGCSLARRGLRLVTPLAAALGTLALYALAATR
jgi:hypothetical protein